MNNFIELKSTLASFYGTEGYHFNPLYKWMKYTDGVKFFAENAGNGAYWFLDILGTELRELAKKEAFLSIVLHVQGSNALIAADDGNGNGYLYTRDIDYTDCPEGVWKFYLVDGVLMLTTEY